MYVFVRQCVNAKEWFTACGFQLHSLYFSINVFVNIKGGAAKDSCA